MIVDQGTKNQEYALQTMEKGRTEMPWEGLVEEDKLPGDGILETASKEEVGCETIFDGAPPSGTFSPW